MPGSMCLANRHLKRNLQHDRGKYTGVWGAQRKDSPSTAPHLRQGDWSMTSRRKGILIKWESTRQGRGGKALQASETRRKRQDMRLKGYMRPKLSRAWEWIMISKCLWYNRHCLKYFTYLHLFNLPTTKWVGAYYSYSIDEEVEAQ